MAELVWIDPLGELPARDLLIAPIEKLLEVADLRLEAVPDVEVLREQLATLSTTLDGKNFARSLRELAGSAER